MSAAVAEKISGKIECPECGRMTCQVFHDGGKHCFHPTCDFHSSATNKRGEPAIPKRKKPKASRRALDQFEKLPPADAKHPYPKEKRHKGDLSLPIIGNVRQDGDRLAVPMTDSKGVLRNIQYIYPDGKKRNLEGMPKRGLFNRLGDGYTKRAAIAEGWATGVSFNHASGIDTYVSFGCDNLAAVAEYVKGTGKELVVCGDAAEDSVRKAEQVASAVGGSLFIAQFPDGVSGSDANDLAQKLGIEELRRQIEKTTQPIPPPVDVINLLADMPPNKFRKQRESLAAQLGMSAEVLEQRVKQARQEIRFEEVIPWAEPVDGAELADAIYNELDGYMSMSESALVGTTLWAIFTHVIDEFRIAPILNVTSPEKRCGKTKLLECLDQIVARSVMTSNVSTAAVFRTQELHQPTFLVDEGDSFIKMNEELRGILNSGHTRSGAYVIRCVGEDNTPVKFCTWGAKAIAAIKDLPETIIDRSVVISMKRKLSEDKRRRLREPQPGDAWDHLRRKIVRWTDDNSESIASESVKRVKGLHDRASDNWEPLLQIAKCLGGEWYKDAKEAALNLAAQESSQDDSNGVLLLQDLHQLFEDEGDKALWTTDILGELHKMEDRPWPEYGKDHKPISDSQLSNLLKPYGIKPKPVRRRGSKKQRRGYRLRDCADAFARYAR